MFDLFSNIKQLFDSRLQTETVFVLEYKCCHYWFYVQLYDFYSNFEILFHNNIHIWQISSVALLLCCSTVIVITAETWNVLEADWLDVLYTGGKFY